MVSEAALAALSTKVVAAAFALGIAFGAIAHRTNFCTMGSIADVVSFGDWTRLRMWALALAVAIVGATLLTVLGAIDPAASFYTTRRFTPLAHIVGGLLFGFGMVLAGGCGSKALVRAGAGSLKALIVILVVGVFAYITLRGMLALVRVHAIESVRLELTTPQDLPSLIAGAANAPIGLRVIVATAVVAALALFIARGRTALTRDALLGGLGVGLVIVGAWYVSGDLGHVHEHPATLEDVYLRTNSGRMEALSFVAPLAYTLDYLMFFSDASKVITIGIAGVLGVLAGSASDALWTGNFHWQGFHDTEDTANHLFGAALMGFGGVTALGCTIGQGISGASLLAIGSWLTIAAIALGAVAALRYQQWRIAKG